jgi:hypothetical protein
MRVSKLIIQKNESAQMKYLVNESEQMKYSVNESEQIKYPLLLVDICILQSH